MAEQAGADQTSQQQTQQTPTRPDYIEEKFWDAEKGAPKVEDLAKSYREIQTRFSQGKDAFKTEYEAERFKGRPADAAGYALKPPEKGVPEGLVLLDKKPGDDFKPEGGKRYFVMDDKHPLLGWWRDHAFKAGLSQDEFMGGVLAFAQSAGDLQPSDEAIKEFRSKEYAKLGEHGAARVDHAWKRLTALVGEEHAKALDGLVGTAEGAQALEVLLEKAGEPKFNPQVATGGPAPTEADLRKIMLEPDYYTNKEKQQKVADGFKKLYPVQAVTHVTGPGARAA